MFNILQGMFSSLLCLLWMETENTSAASSAMRKLAVSLADSLGRVQYPSFKSDWRYKYILKIHIINWASSKKFSFYSGLKKSWNIWPRTELRLLLAALYTMMEVLRTEEDEDIREQFRTELSRFCSRYTNQQIKPVARDEKELNIYFRGGGCYVNWKLLILNNSQNDVLNSAFRTEHRKGWIYRDGQRNFNDHQIKDGNAQLTTVPFKPLSDK